MKIERIEMTNPASAASIDKATADMGRAFFLRIISEDRIADLANIFGGLAYSAPGNDTAFVEVMLNGKSEIALARITAGAEQPISILAFLPSANLMEACEPVGQNKVIGAAKVPPLHVITDRAIAIGALPARVPEDYHCGDPECDACNEHAAADNASKHVH